MALQYIGARYVPKFYEGSNGSAWDSGIPYEPLTIVTYLGSSWTSKKQVPATVGAPNLNPDYWVLTGNYNAQIDEVLEALSGIQEDITGIQGDVRDLETETGKINDELIDNNARKLFGSYAHRGYGYNTQPLPQNSLPSYYQAASDGFRGIEIDIQYDANGTIVCIHDIEISSLTNKSGNMKDYDYTEVYLKNDINGEVSIYNPPTLEQTLMLCKECNLVPNIEFKYNALNPYVDPDEVIELLNKYNIKDYLLNISPLSILGAPKYRDIWKVTNDYSASGITAEEAAALKENYGNVAIYLNTAMQIENNNFIDIIREAGLLSIGKTSQPLSDTTDAKKADLYLLDVAATRNVITTFISAWVTATLEEGFGTGDTSNWALKYRRAGNVVEIQGSVTGFENNNGTSQIFLKLPAGFRPPHTKCYTAFASYSNKDYVGDFRINSDGNCYLIKSNAAVEETSLAFVIDFCFTVG